MTGACVLLLCLGSNVYLEFFEQGNAAYARGAMEEAVQAYDQLVASGSENAEVFYNLGNAHYHRGEMGRAVLNYERAVGLDGSFDAARSALALAVEKTAHQYEPPSGFSLAGREATLIPGISGRRSGAVALVFWWLAWGILVAGQCWRRRTWRTALSAAALAYFLIALMLAIPVDSRRAAVVLSGPLPARYGPDIRDDVRMELASGDRVLVDDSIGDWVRVELADGRRGWVARSYIAYLGPPFSAELNERENPTP